jgi:hypothetical protein
MKLSKLSLRIAELRPCPSCNQSGGLWDNEKLGSRCGNPQCFKGKLLRLSDDIRAGRTRLETELLDAELEQFANGGGGKAA